jgi:hypothetical protein
MFERVDRILSRDIFVTNRTDDSFFLTLTGLHNPGSIVWFDLPKIPTTGILVSVHPVDRIFYFSTLIFNQMRIWYLQISFVIFTDLRPVL